MKKVQLEDGSRTLQGIPFVVPGARFNELYNWDSYFISLLVGITTAGGSR